MRRPINTERNRMRHPGWRWGIPAATIATIALNGMAPLFSPTGKNVGQISDQFPNFFTPAGYVFSIWGLIYLALIGFSVYQALPAQKESKTLAQIEEWYVVSCACNGLWIICWQREWFVPSLLLMVGLLAALLRMYLLQDGKRQSANRGESWFVHWMLSVYLGWITVATVANVTIVLQTLGWEGTPLSGQMWGAIMMVVALLVVLFTAVPRRDKAYLLVLAWATAGIAAKHPGNTLITATGYAVSGICILLALLFLLGIKLPIPTPKEQ